MGSKNVSSKAWKWGLGLVYIFLVATIWIAASFVVQSVVDAGVSPFLVTYICNSLFVVLIPIVEIGRYLEDSYGGLWFWRTENSNNHLEGIRESEQAILLDNNVAGNKAGESLVVMEDVDAIQQSSDGSELPLEKVVDALHDEVSLIGNVDNQLDDKGRWTRYRVAKVSLLICPFWFFAQLTFNLSLKYTTVTVSICRIWILPQFLSSVSLHYLA